ncbi:MAG: alcohol dehydrogenase catalytic domain-containing protein [FCB group bacterium]|nr:alcohol dehydrogenase catalytic domain-containing protein [FCB group bacterium]
MDCIQITEPGSIQLDSLPDPIRKISEAIIQPLAGGICGTDVHIFQGNFIGNYPVIPCHEFSGKIVQIDDGITGLMAGDMVAVDPNIRCGKCEPCRRGKKNICRNYSAIGVTRPGGFSELVSVPVENLFPYEGGNITEAAFAEPLACVLYGQSRLDLEENRDILLFGAGAIGLLHLQVLSRIHSSRVTVVDIDSNRLERAKLLGAHSVIQANADCSSELDKSSQRWDIVIDATGKTEPVEKMFKFLKSGGQALLFGVYPKEKSFLLNAFDVFLNDWQIFGSFTYRDEFASAVELLAEGRLDVDYLVDERIQLKEVPEVMKLLNSGEKMGKVQVII